MSITLQYIYLVIPYLLLVVIETTPLKEMHVPIIGFVTFCYLLFSFISRKRTPSENEQTSLFTTAIILFLVLSVISLTGGTHSLFFFLLYFLAFLIAFTAPPETIFVFAASTVLFYLLLEGKQTDSFSLSLHLLSVVLLSPLAYFFGKEYQEQAREKNMLAKLEAETTQVTENISDDIRQVLETDKASLSLESIEKLNDILEESQEIKEEIRKDL